MGNRQPIKQFKPSPRVGMTAGNTSNNAGAQGQIVRPGTAGSTFKNNTSAAASSKGFQQQHQQIQYQAQMSNSKGFN